LNISMGMLIVCIFISLIGMALLLYGRKETRIPHMVAGLVLLVFPYFVGKWWIAVVITAVVITAVVLAALAVISKLGY
jgi:hypothetical protein